MTQLLQVTRVGYADLIRLTYVSQMDSTISGKHNNDCLAAAVSSVLSGYLHEVISPDDLYDFVKPVGDTYLQTTDAGKLFKKYLGVGGSYSSHTTLEQLRSILSTNTPVIALINEGEWLRRGYHTKSNFVGAHFVTIVGFDTFNFHILNPLDYGIEKQPVAVKIDDWMQIWGNTEVQGNRPRSIVYPDVSLNEWVERSKLTEEAGNETYEVTVNGLNIRSQPRVGADTLTYKAAYAGQTYKALDTKETNTAKWIRIGLNQWIAAQYLGVEYAKRKV